MARRRPIKRWMYVTALLIVQALVLAACADEKPMSYMDPHGTHAQRIFDLLVPVFWAAVAVFVVVEGILIYSVLRFRRKPNDGIPVQIHGNTTIEVMWTIAPALIVLVIAVLTFRTQAENQALPENALQIHAVGHQWWFRFEYPEQGIATANDMYIPVGRDVTITLDGQDVVHNFWVPKLAGKTYMIPNNPNYIAFNARDEGVYYGHCSEFCGEAHALMRFRVIAVQPEVFDQWVAAQKTKPAEPTAAGAIGGGDPVRGKEVFVQKACFSCHVIADVDKRGANNAPNLTYLGSRTTLAAGIIPNTPENLARWLRDPGAIKPGNLMSTVVKPGYLSEQEIADLVAYLEGQKIPIQLPPTR